MHSNTKYRKPTARLAARQQGIALVLVLVALVMGTIIGVAFLTSQQTTTGIAENVNKQAKARGIAESALVMVANHIETDADWRDSFVNGTWASDVASNGGTFTVTVQDGVINSGGGVDGDGSLSDDTSDKIVITALGRFGGVTHTIKAEVTPTASEQIIVDVLMTVKDPDDLDDQELARKELIESWGWNVALIDESASQDDYDAAVEANDVVYVPENILSGNIGDKLKEATKGVVLEERYLIDDMEIANGSASFSGTTIDIVDNTHYITQEFDSGEQVQIVSESQELGGVSGSYPVGFLNLAEKHNDDELSMGAMDAGQTLMDGSVVASRRVLLPWANSNFDVSSLTEDGKTILKRSLYWGSLSPVVSANQVGLAVTDRFYLPDYGVIDSYNSALGFYGGDNVGSAAVVTTNSTSSNKIQVLDNAIIKGSAYVGPGGNPSSVIQTTGDGTITGAKYTLAEEIPMPEIEVPDDLPASSGDLTYTSGTTVISSDIRCGEFVVKNDTIIQISGNVTIYCDDWFRMEDNSQLQLLEGASLKLYAEDKNGVDAIRFKDNARFNANTQEPGRATLFILSTGELDMDDAPKVYARVIAPNGEMDVNDDTEFFGTFIGREIVVEQRGQLHHAIDISPYYGDTPTVVDEGGEDEEAEAPELIVEYKFNEIPLDTPELVGHWLLDETVVASSGGGAGAVRVKDRIELEDDAIIDSYDSTVGIDDKGSAAVVSTNSTSSDRIEIKDDGIIKGSVYVGEGGSHWHVIDLDDDGTITGDRDDQDEDFEFPSIEVPGFVSYDTDETISSNTTWSSDQRFDELKIKNYATVTITGNINVRIDEKFKMEDHAEIELADGASVNFYCYDKIEFKDDIELNRNTSDPSRVYIYSLSDQDITLEGDADVHAHMITPDADVEIKDSADLYGSLLCDDLKIKDSGDLHVDVASGAGGGGGGGTTTAEDESEYLNNGTYEGGVVSTESGQFEGAMYFGDGEEGYVEIPHSDAYLLDNGTIAFWFKPETVSGEQGIFSKDSNGYDDGGHVHVYLDGSTLKVRLQSTSTSKYVTKSSISSDTWYHVAFSWGDQGMKLFVNGSLADTDDYTGGLGTTSGGSGNSEPIVLGADSSTSDNSSATPLEDYFQGWMDDVRIYNQPFDEGQAENVMNGDEPGESNSPGKIVKDTSGYGEPLDLEIVNTDNVSWVYGGGLVFEGETKAVSQNAATKIHTALTESNEFTIEVKFTPYDLEQSGPANIVSMSSGPGSRNFAVGQDDAAYVSMVRTDGTGSDGEPEIASADVITEDALQHLVITFDGESVKMWRNGTLEKTATREGDLSTWSDAFNFIIGSDDNDDNPWLGTLHRVAMYDEALNGVQVGDIYAGNPPRAVDETENTEFKVRWYENP